VNNFKNYNFIFLLYFSRSGSTYFSKVLAENCKDLTILPESNYFRIILSHYKIYKKFDPKNLTHLILEDPKFKFFEVSRENLMTALRLCNNHLEAIMAVTSLILENRKRSDYKNVLIKDGGLVDFVGEIRSLFPNPKILFIQRDPRGCINSLLHSPKIFLKGNSSMGWNDIEMCCSNYMSYLKKINKLETCSIYNVTYESLLRNEIQATKRALVYITLEASIEKVAVAKNFILQKENIAHRNVFERAKKNRAYAWKHELEDWEIKYIEFRLSKFIPLALCLNNNSNLNLACLKAASNHLIGATRLNLYRVERYLLKGNFNLLLLKLQLKMGF